MEYHQMEDDEALARYIFEMKDKCYSINCLRYLRIYLFTILSRRMQDEELGLQPGEDILPHHVQGT